jgi:hypothetical protein
LDGGGLGGDHSLPLNELEYAMNPSQISAPWVLSKGCAVTFSPRRAGVLRVAEGRAWVTFEMPQAARFGDAGDHFVGFGQALAVRAGQCVVIEAWPAAGASSIRLAWEPLANPFLGSRWETAVAEPLRDLRQGLALVGSALARLAVGWLPSTNLP